MSDAGFARVMDCLGPFEARPHIAVAVSGGPDSLALMHLLTAWCRARGGHLTAVTVDHGLRPESGAEAQKVAGWARGIGASAVILTWLGEKPQSGLQAAARQMRYELLTDWCRRADVLHLALAHQADDQRETVAMRQARAGKDEPPGPGLAGMSAITVRHGIRLLRPMLGFCRASIAAYLDRIGQDWIEDPSNRSLRFERVRWRSGLMGRLPDGADIQTAGERRRRLEFAAADLLMCAAEIAPAGYVLLDPVPIRAAAVEVAEWALGQVLMMVGGGSYRPARAALRRDMTVALAGKGVRSLAGCLFGLWRQRLLICRETGAAAGIVEGPGSFMWDRRFRVTCGAGGPAGFPLEIGQLGERGLRELEKTPESSQFLGPIPALARPSLPVFRDATGRLILVPFTGYDPVGCRNELNCRFDPYNSATSIGFTVA
ncbi:tRNA(Ile)-lysidine synthase [Dongia mobilis]|uniref:tRNA(Ile)-lysidine synthase n=1 Tax=Dongia mobilis TaxID=578943 RepID=A0A4R6WD71_9PROT|nr:tRNA(Ile)-lysidine synthase [Dongia mobilis]